MAYHPAPVSPPALAEARASRVLPAGAPPWSTAALLDQAVTWMPAIRESAANVRSLTAAARAARVPLPAALQLTAEYSHDDNPDKPWLGAIAADIPLDIGGRRNGRVSAADLAVVQARYDYAEAVWTARSAIARARIDRIFVERLAPLAAHDLALRLDRYERMQARLRAGEEARPIVIAAQTDLAAAERRARDIAARGNQADVALATAIGIDPSAVAHLPLEPLPERPLIAPADRVRLRGEAAAGRRDLLRAIVDYDLAENAVRLEVANQYPALRIQPGYTYERGLVKLPFGLNLQLPPVDMNRAAIAAAEARRAQAGIKLETIQASIFAEVDRTSTALDAQSLSEQLTATRDLPLAQKLALAAAANLRMGEGDRVDADAAEATEIETEMALIEAQRTAWLALVDLEDALRHPTDPRDAKALDAAMARLGGAK